MDKPHPIEQDALGGVAGGLFGADLRRELFVGGAGGWGGWLAASELLGLAGVEVTVGPILAIPVAAAAVTGVVAKQLWDRIPAWETIGNRMGGG